MDCPFKNGFTLIGSMLLTLLITACGGGGSNDGGGLDSNLAPPGNLNIFQGVDFDSIIISWTPPPMEITGYDIEGRFNDEPFEKQNEEPLEPDVTGLEVSFEQLPELTEISVRMRSLNGSSYSDYSEAATYLSGLRTPANLLVTVDNYENLAITWTNTSQAAQQIRLERAEYNTLTHTKGEYSTIAELESTEVSYVDETVEIGSLYYYQLTYEANWNESLISSMPKETLANGRPTLAPPTNMVATLGATGVTLTWINQSSKASGIRVYRVDGYDITELLGQPDTTDISPYETTWFDSMPEPGIYTYSVAATLEPVSRARSEISSVVIAPGNPGEYDISVEWMPKATGIAKDGLGQFHFTINPNLYPPGGEPSAIFIPEPSGWFKLDEPADFRLFAAPSIMADQTGRSHTVYLASNDYSTTNPVYKIIYAAPDSSGLQDELVAESTVWASTVSPGSWFSRAPNGTIHLLWENNPHQFHTYATNESGNWAVAPLTSALYDPLLAGYPGLATALDSTVFAHNLTYGDEIILQARSLGGVWTEELVDLQTPLNKADAVVILPVDLNTAHIIYEYDLGVQQDMHVTAHMAKIDGVWQPPQEIYQHIGPSVTQFNLQAALSFDGSQVIVLAHTIHEGLLLHTLDTGGNWQTTSIRQNTQLDYTNSPSFHQHWAGFNDTGMPQVLTPVGEVSNGMRTYLLYTKNP